MVTLEQCLKELLYIDPTTVEEDDYSGWTEMSYPLIREMIGDIVSDIYSGSEDEDDPSNELWSSMLEKVYKVYEDEEITMEEWTDGGSSEFIFNFLMERKRDNLVFPKHVSGNPLEDLLQEIKRFNKEHNRIENLVSEMIDKGISFTDNDNPFFNSPEYERNFDQIERFFGVGSEYYPILFDLPNNEESRGMIRSWWGQNIN